MSVTQEVREVILGPCYEGCRWHDDHKLYEGITPATGPAILYRWDDSGTMVTLVSCDTCDAEAELPYIDLDAARKPARAWALEHRCPPGEDV